MKLTLIPSEKFFEPETQRRGDDGYLYIEGLPAGAGAWTGDVLQFMCPCGCGMVGGVGVGPGEWTNSGSRETPTLNPSIQMLGHCRWHGYLTKGEFVKT